MEKMNVRITFTEDVLGTASADENIHREFIASKAPDKLSIEEEIAAVGVDEVIEKSKTVFPRNADGNPILFDYQVKGFFKDTCGMLSRLKKANNESAKINLNGKKSHSDGLAKPILASQWRGSDLQ